MNIRNQIEGTKSRTTSSSHLYPNLIQKILYDVDVCKLRVIKKKDRHHFFTWCTGVNIKISLSPLQLAERVKEKSWVVLKPEACRRSSFQPDLCLKSLDLTCFQFTPNQYIKISSECENNFNNYLYLVAFIANYIFEKV